MSYYSILTSYIYPIIRSIIPLIYPLYIYPMISGKILLYPIIPIHVNIYIR